MTQPDGSDAVRGYEDALSSQRVARSHPAVGTKGRDKLDHRLLRGVVHSILQVGLSAACFKQCLNAADISGCLIPIEGIPEKTHDTASQGDIAQFDRKVEESRLRLMALWLELSIGNSVGIVPG